MYLFCILLIYYCINCRAMASVTLENPDYKTATSIYDFTVLDIKGNPVKLDIYKGHVAIIVNVASQCGLTANNYKQLNELYDQYSETKGMYFVQVMCLGCSGGVVIIVMFD